MSFPELNFRYWSKDSLSKLGSLIGRPLATNKGTQNKNHAKFAKLRIAIDLNQPFPDEATFINEFGILVIKKSELCWETLMMQPLFNVWAFD